MRVGDLILAFCWTDYRKRVQYQTYDVTSLLLQGGNVLGAILGDGWYCGFLAWQNRQQYGEKAHFMGRLEIEFADGQGMTIVTDSSWKTAAGPISESDLLIGRSLWMRGLLELTGWSQPAYDDSAWMPAFIEPPEVSPEIVPRLEAAGAAH